MYGDATIMVLSFGDGVNGFTLDTAIGEFILTHKDIKIPKKGKIYSINEGNAIAFDKAVETYVEMCKRPKVGKHKKARYIGSMVADVHRTLLYGGIFMYPPSEANPRGKLRLLYELSPMSFLIEAAGGRAIDGKVDVLDIQPKEIHERAPVFLGSADDVTELQKLYEELVYKDEKK